MLEVPVGVMGKIVVRITGRHVWLAVAVVVLLPAVPAYASFPGQNGKIAFSSAKGIETVEPDGSNRVSLAIDAGDTTFAYPPWAPAWSADGKRIAFIGVPPGPFRSSIFTANADGSNAIAITGQYEEPRDPAWSLDGSKIAFTKTSYFSQFWATELKLVNSDGTGLTSIRDVAVGSIAQPNWSPVGDEIAYVDDGFRCDYSNWFPWCDDQIWIIAPDGTQLRKLGDDKGMDYEPSWSPDGTKIAFSSTRDRTTCISTLCGDIYTMNADGTGTITRLTSSVGGNTQPVWSPDGKKIAFVSTRDDPDPDCYQNCNSEIYVMNADGGGQTNLTNTSGSEGGPDWQALPNRAPDCSRVLATPNQLSRHGFQAVALSGATDPDGDAVTITIDGVTQDEPVGRRPDARTGAASNEVYLRAERRPRGDGRVYRIAFTASDGSDQCSGVATVEVRRKKKQSAVDSAPPSYDSFSGNGG
jgi:TolB protein